MTAPTLDAVAPSIAASVPARVMRESATALADPGSLATVELFLAAHGAASKAWERASLTDTGGWGGIDAEAERLVAEAAHFADLLATGWASGMAVDPSVMGAVREYAGRHRRVSYPAVVQAGSADWSRWQS